MDVIAVVGVLLLVLPSAGLLGLYVASRGTLKAELPRAAFRGVQVSWLVSAAAMLVGPFLTVYTTWTTLGRLDAPAPGFAGFRVASWLLLGGLGLFFVGAAIIFGVAAWRRFVE